MKTSKDSLGDRIKKNYENRARHYLTRRTPVIIRVDGKAFHTFTRDMKRPFDIALVESMRRAAISTADRIQGCVAVYVASDEVSFLLTDWASLKTDAWFDYNQSKIESVSAATMTAWFNAHFAMYTKSFGITTEVFDARAFNIPKEEAVNYFLWRMKDWERNSVTMLASTNFSHKQLQGVSTRDRISMLEVAGVRWSDLPSHLKNGSFFVKHTQTDDGFVEKTFDDSPTYEKIAAKLRFLERNNDIVTP